MRLAIVAALGACVALGAGRLGAQSRPLTYPPAGQLYTRLLRQIERIRIFDHHAHPAFPDDADVDPAPPPPGATPLRMRDDSADAVAAARALFGFPFHDLA